jgi:hypothetical protein
MIGLLGSSMTREVSSLPRVISGRPDEPCQESGDLVVGRSWNPCNRLLDHATLSLVRRASGRSRQDPPTSRKARVGFDRLPYWESEKYVRTSSPGVKVSIYNRPQQGMIAVVANMGQGACRAEVTFDLAALQQTTGLAAHEVPGDKKVPFTAGRLELPLESMGSLVVWFKPR